MGGGSRSRSWVRERVANVYREALRGSLPGLDPTYVDAAQRDALSPGLRRRIAKHIAEKFRSYLEQGVPEGDALRRAVEDGNEFYRRLCGETRKIFESVKPRAIYPRNLANPSIQLSPEHVGLWHVRKRGVDYVTLWFRYPYDIAPGDGPEYEPVTLVIRRGKLIEVQTRTHWRIVRVKREVLHVVEKGPVIAFSDHGHTPLPILDIDAVSRVCSLSRDRVVEDMEKAYRRVYGLDVPVLSMVVKGLLTFQRPPKVFEELAARGMIIIEKRGGVEDELAYNWFGWNILAESYRYHFEKPRTSEVDPAIHIGPSRKEVRRWRRNPLKAPWLREVQ